MKKSELIKKYASDIREVMTERYRTVLDSYGRIQYGIYLWSDGQIECLEDIQGSSSYLIAKDSESRELHYVCTVSAPCFDPWDYSDHSAPDDPEEMESERIEIIDYLVGEYGETASEIINSAIAEAKQEEDEELYLATHKAK